MNLVYRRPKARLILAAIGIPVLIALIGLFWLANGIASNVLRSQAEELLGKNVTMGSVHVSLWRGTEIVVKDLALAQPPGYGKGDLLRTKHLRIRFDLFPLFNRQIIIRGIHINSPSLTIAQKSDGSVNTEVYLRRFMKGPKKADTPYTFRLNYFKLQNAELTVVSPRLSSYQPAFHLKKCHLFLRNLTIPNPNLRKTRFTFSGNLVATRAVPIRLSGEGTFGAGPVSFKADSRIENLPLADFAHLYQRSSIRVKQGDAWVVSHADCKKGYLQSTHKANVRGLKVEQKSGIFRSFIYGLPANLFIKLVEDQNGTLQFKFTVAGRLSELKVHTKRTVSSAIGQGLKARFSYIYKLKFKEKTVGGAKKFGKKTKRFFKKVFHRK